MGQILLKLKNGCARLLGPLGDDEVKFRLMTTLKISSIPFFTLAILGIYMNTVLKLNLIYFKANGFGRVLDLQEAYYEYVLAELSEALPFMAGIFVVIVFLGLYLADMLLRSFRNIGTYCENAVEGKEAIYNPDFVTDLALLTGFSEYFFNITENALKSGKLAPMEVPAKFTRIHGPVFEKTFFLQFTFFLTMTSIALASAIYAVSTDVYGHIVELSIETLKQNQSMIYFLKEQQKLIQDIILGVMISHIVLYALLAVHLYNKVAVPAFGFFATMRAFLKGNHGSRIHLIGQSYVRPEGRKLNKYLETVERRCSGKSDKA